MPIKILRLTGWLMVSAGIGCALLCLALILNRSPGDTEQALIEIVIVALGLISLASLALGLILKSFAHRKAKSRAT